MCVQRALDMLTRNVCAKVQTDWMSQCLCNSNVPVCTARIATLNNKRRRMSIIRSCDAMNVVRASVTLPFRLFHKHTKAATTTTTTTQPHSITNNWNSSNTNINIQLPLLHSFSTDVIYAFTCSAS